jgi:parallel beta helix pectate lyase-like protein
MHGRDDGAISRGIAALLASCLLLVGTAAVARAATIIVPADQPTIAAALAVAAPGDTVLVQPGTYAESVHVVAGRQGLTIAGAADRDPPVVLGAAGSQDAGVWIDQVDDVTVRNLVVRGWADGVRVDAAYGATLKGLAIEGAGVGVRVEGGGHDALLESAIAGTTVGEGVRIERAPETVVRNVTVDATRGDGIVAWRSHDVTIDGTTVSNVQGRHGIFVVRSSGAALVGATSRRNAHDGICVRTSAHLQLRRNDAEDNGSVGLRIVRSIPFGSVHDVAVLGNDASANTRRDIVVRRPNCAGHRCGVVPPSPGPKSSTTTTPSTTTTTAPASLPPTIPSTTTSTTLPREVPVWRLYVRVAREAQSQVDVDVPLRSSDPPLVIAVPTHDLAAFRIGDQVTAAEITAVDTNLLALFADAASAYLAGHPSDYPGVTGLVDVRWAMRVSGDG